MFKLIKYELRGTFLTIIGISIFIIIATLLLLTKKDSWSDAVPVFSVCLTIGAIIVIFISSLKIMSNYLYEDSGSLLFTLPQSGVSIIASRLITALIQISIVSFVSIFMNYLTITDKIPIGLFKDVKISVLLYSAIAYIWTIVSLLTFIYFCMVIGKVALKGKKLGKIGSFVIFIMLSVAISWLSIKITVLFPQTLNLISAPTISHFKTTYSGFSISGGVVNMNIAQTILNIITFVVLFITTSFLIDKKLDLS